MEFNYYSISHLRDVKLVMKFNGLIITLKYVFNVLQDTIRWSNLLFLIRDYVMYVHRRWHSVREGMIFNY